MAAEQNTEGRQLLRRVPGWTRGCAVIVLVGVWCLAIGYPVLIGALGGAWSEPGDSWLEELSPEARLLVERGFGGLDPDRLVDLHTHLAGIGTGSSGCEVHPNMLSWSQPVARIRFELYLSASGVEDLERADQEFVARLSRLIDRSPGKGRFCLLAFDHAYGEDGQIDRETSEFYVPNEWAWQQAMADPERLLPAISVHPYREDALEELERWAARGVRIVKWLPNAMNIDPSSPRCDAFYEKIVELDMTILTHTGKEMAVEAGALQALGNPLHLRRPLDRGVRVIAAHCASLGEALDLDEPEGEREMVPCFELFMRLMDEPGYEGLLFGEISAMTLANRVGAPLAQLLDRPDLHPRLVNGSDYPLPALNAVIRLSPLVDQGFLKEEDVSALREIYEAHPLAFDLVLKRSLRSPTTGRGFGVEAFLVPDELGL